MNSFPFNIKDVAIILGLKSYKTPSTVMMDTDCPFCGDKKGHLNINFKKDSWRCVKCDAGGGMLKLYADIRGCSQKEAYREICEKLNICSKEDYKKRTIEMAEKVKEIPDEGFKPNFDKIHIIYNVLLDNLTLSKEHKEGLLKRGLNEGIIRSNKYKSMPKEDEVKDLVNQITEQTGIIDFSGVPGFYIKDNEWTFTDYPQGTIIPIRNFAGKIVGAQVRRDVEKKKYKALSSSYLPSGTKSISMVHVVGNFADNPKRVYLTEGGLKGDVASFLSGYPFICVQGVNSQNNLEGLLKRLRDNGTEEIAIAFDMDRYENPQVAKAIISVKEKIIKSELIPIDISWDLTYKGIDDFFYSKHVKR